jgi:DNA invertase Pin-like site-specific DNA recombinase
LSVALTFVQVAVEILLVILLLILWRRAKAVRPEEPARLPEDLEHSLGNFLAEASKLSAAFEKNLQDKKNLSADLILKLDRRLSDYQNLLKQAEVGFQIAQKKLAGLRPDGAASAPAADQANPAAPEVRAMVLQMAKKGHPPEEIAAKTRLHLGEVELIIDLERQFSL